jgi:hypothetical protein
MSLAHFGVWIITEHAFSASYMWTTIANTMPYSLWLLSTENVGAEGLNPQGR